MACTGTALLFINVLNLKYIFASIGDFHTYTVGYEVWLFFGTLFYDDFSVTLMIGWEVDDEQTRTNIHALSSIRTHEVYHHPLVAIKSP
jgi:hypothetical protein